MHSLPSNASTTLRTSSPPESSRSAPSDTTLVYFGEESPAVLPTDPPVGPLSGFDGGGDVSESSPDVTFHGFPSSDEEGNGVIAQNEPALRRSSESSEYLSAVDALDQSAAVSHPSAESDPRSSEPKSESSGGHISPSRDSSDISSGSPPERPRYPGRNQRYPQRVRQRRTVLTYESLGEPHVSEYKIPSLPRHLR